MIKFKHTSKKLGQAANLLIKGLKSQLRLQEYYATGKLNRSFAGTINKTKNLILDITSSKHYWRVVNDPKVAFSVNKQNIIRWMNTKGLNKKFAQAIYLRLKRGIYANRKANGKENYVYWQHGNTLTRSNFAGITAKENSAKVAQELAPAIGKDVANMIAAQIKKNNPKTNVSKAF
tara:strand:+ start:6289 stop:6816 length:528 start_codon:yes stop_codon:yes gene_type:complete